VVPRGRGRPVQLAAEPPADHAEPGRQHAGVVLGIEQREVAARAERDPGCGGGHCGVGDPGGRQPTPQVAVERREVGHVAGAHRRLDTGGVRVRARRESSVGQSSRSSAGVTSVRRQNRK
jgi:hypothetical protein